MSTGQKKPTGALPRMERRALLAARLLGLCGAATVEALFVGLLVWLSFRSFLENQIAVFVGSQMCAVMRCFLIDS
jgi:hypothetical protein